MLRDVPHCKCILKCGVGAMVFAIVMMTWVYPAYCSRVMQVKEQKVEEYVEGTYGIHVGTVDNLMDTVRPAAMVPEPLGLPEAAQATPAPSTDRADSPSGVDDVTSEPDA